MEQINIPWVANRKLIEKMTDFYGFINCLCFSLMSFGFKQTKKLPEIIGSPLSRFLFYLISFVF